MKVVGGGVGLGVTSAVSKFRMVIGDDDRRGYDWIKSQTFGMFVFFAV